MLNPRFQQLLLICGTSCLLSSCTDAPAKTFAPVIPLPDRPVAEVIVYTFPSAVQVGDTLTVNTEAFDSRGQITGLNAIASWVHSDSALVAVSTIGSRGRALLVRGQQAGTLSLVATIGGVTGTNSLRVVPAFAPLRLEPSSVTIRRGDSVMVYLRVTDQNGIPVTGLIVGWESANLSLVRNECCRDSTFIRVPLAGDPGFTIVRVTTAHASISLPVTVIPR